MAWQNETTPVKTGLRFRRGSSSSFHVRTDRLAEERRSPTAGLTDQRAEERAFHFQA